MKTFYFTFIQLEVIFTFYLKVSELCQFQAVVYFIQHNLSLAWKINNLVNPYWYQLGTHLIKYAQNLENDWT